MNEPTVTVRFEVKDPDVIGFIIGNTAETGSIFEFREYAVIELKIVHRSKGAQIQSARFVPRREWK